MLGTKVLISVQASYLLYVNATGVLTCDNVIDVPLCFATKKQNRIDDGIYTVLPVIEVVSPVSMSEFKIITNEGITVEPFTTFEMNGHANPYSEPRTFFVLPRDATGIKSVIAKTKSDSYKTSLEFGIMPPPYNYEMGLDGVISDVLIYRGGQIENLDTNIKLLDDKVDTLESKNNGLKVVLDLPSFSSINIPKGQGKYYVNVREGNLFFETEFNYTSSSSAVHSPKITVSDDWTTKVYTLSLHKSASVMIDLLTGTITAYVKDTGEIVQQLKIFGTTYGYKTIAFEDFDDISNNGLYVLATGRRVK